MIDFTLSTCGERDEHGVDPATTEADGIAIRPLEPTIGAEISGVDLRHPLSDDVRDRIKAAILEYKVVFFRGQHLDQGQHAAFAAQFGPLYTHPHGKQAQPNNVTAIHRIAATDAKEYEKVRELRDSEGWDPYHTDTSWRLVPTWGAVLRAVNLPDVGGDTVWVDAGLAYENLPDDVKERLEGLHVTHDYRAALNQAGVDYPIVAHPIVRVHRETGKRILWVNFTQRPLDHRPGPGGRAGNSCRSFRTSTASPSTRSASRGARARWRSGTTGPPSTTRCATTATSPGFSSAS